jgi:hypothetical protein
MKNSYRIVSIFDTNLYEKIGHYIILYNNTKYNISKNILLNKNSQKLKLICGYYL